MFGLFGPRKCPISLAEKVWIEQRFRWLAKAFGSIRLLGARVIEPTAKFFPEEFDHTPRTAETIFARSCEYLGLPRTRFRLRFYPGTEHDALGYYYQLSPEEIHLNEYILEEPTDLIATITHELSHALLLGDGRISNQSQDHELTTDLTTVFLGTGIFGANGVMRETAWTSGLSSYWRVSRRGYLSEREFAYALALFAWLRGEARPAWVKHLRLNVRSVFKDGIRFLSETGDALFSPEEFARINGPADSETTSDLVELLASQSPGDRLAGLWELRRSPETAAKAIGHAIKLLSDSDEVIRQEAAYLLGTAGPAAVDATTAVLESIPREGAASVRAALAWALGRIRGRSNDSLTELFRLAHDADERVRMEATGSLKAFASSVEDQRAEQLLDARLFDRSLEVRERTLQLLCRIPKSKFPRFATHLVEMLDDPERAMLPDLLRALGRLGPEYQGDLGPRVREELTNGNALEQIAAAEALVWLEHDVAVATETFRQVQPLPFLENGVSVQYWQAEVHAAVRRALSELRDPLHEHLVLLLDAKTMEELAFAVWSLGHLGDLPESTLTRLNELLSHSSGWVRLLASCSYWRASKQAEPAVHALLGLIPGKKVFGRFENLVNATIEAVILQIGAPALPVLLTCLTHDNTALVERTVSLLANLALQDAEFLAQLDRCRREGPEPSSTQIARALALQATIREQSLANERRTRSYPPAVHENDDSDGVARAIEDLFSSMAKLTK